MSGSSDFKTPSEYRMGQNGHPDLILTTSDHLPSGQQWKPPHYLWISIGHPLEGPGRYCIVLCERFFAGTLRCSRGHASPFFKPFADSGKSPDFTQNI